MPKKTDTSGPMIDSLSQHYIRVVDAEADADGCVLVQTLVGPDGPDLAEPVRRIPASRVVPA